MVTVVASETTQLVVPQVRVVGSGHHFSVEVVVVEVEVLHDGLTQAAALLEVALVQYALELELLLVEVDQSHSSAEEVEDVLQEEVLVDLGGYATSFGVSMKYGQRDPWTKLASCPISGPVHRASGPVVKHGTTAASIISLWDCVQWQEKSSTSQLSAARDWEMHCREQEGMMLS